MAPTMKDAVFWDMTPCGPTVNIKKHWAVSPRPKAYKPLGIQLNKHREFTFTV
jgi:hypothetical protein